MTIEFTVPAEELASAVHYVAKWLDGRPAIPAHGGVLFEVKDGTLTLAGFNENVTAKASIAREKVPGEGSFVVSGRLLDQLVSTFPAKPVRFEQDGTTVSVAVGSFRGALPVMSGKDYPTLPSQALLAGVVDGGAFADAVHRVGAAAKRDTSTQLALCGIHLTFDTPDGPESFLTLTATSGVAACQQWLSWSPDAEGAPFGEAVLMLGATLVDAVDAFADHDEVAIGWEDGVFSLTTPERSLVVRTLDAKGYPREMLDDRFSWPTQAAVTVRNKDLMLPLKRADLLRGKNGETVRLDLRENLLTVSASGDAEGGEEVDVKYDGPDASVWFKSGLLRDALLTAPSETAILSFVPGQVKPVIVTAPGHPEWKHMLVPLRPQP